MITIKTTITLAAVSTLLVGGTLLLKPTATHHYPRYSVELPMQNSNITIATGQTPMFPNVTPQTASGSPQKANVTPQATATTVDQYNGGRITN